MKLLFHLHFSYTSVWYLSVTLLLSIRLPQLLQVSDGAARFYQDFLCAFCVRRVGRLSQIQELVPFLAPEPDPVKMLPHGRHRLATLYLSMTANEAREGERKVVTVLDTMFVDLMDVLFSLLFEQCGESEDASFIFTSINGPKLSQQLLQRIKQRLIYSNTHCWM